MNLLPGMTQLNDDMLRSISFFALYLLLLILVGFNRSGRKNLNNIWTTDGTGIDIFRLTMSPELFFPFNEFVFDLMMSRSCSTNF